MPHPLADVLFDHLIEVFSPDQAYGLAAFKREEMPPPIAHFLSVALQHGLGVEADAFLEVRSSWFDYEHPDVQEAFDLFIGVLGDHALVPASAWAETLAQAVAEVADYLVQPVDTLVGFIFGQQEALPAYTVFSRFEYFAPYNYLHDVASTYAQEKELDKIDRAHFRALLEKVDRQMTEDLDAAGWLDLLEPLYGFAERAANRTGVPLPLLYTFFGAKGAEQVLARLETKRDTSEADVLSRGELQRLLEEALPSSVSRSSAPVAPAPETARGADQPVPLWMQFQRQEHQRREAVASPPPPPPPPPTAPEESTSPVPLWMRFQQQSGQNGPPPQPPPPPSPQAPAPRPDSGPPRYATFTQPPTPAPPVSAPPPSPPPSPEPPSRPTSAPAPSSPPPSAPAPAPPEEAPLAKAPPAKAPSPLPPPDPPRVATPPPPEPEDELTALERIVLGAFEQEQREQYIERLFGGSHEAYEETLRQLEAAPSWQQASSIIAQEVFRKHQVNIYSRLAVIFTNAVEARFDEETFTEDR